MNPWPITPLTPADLDFAVVDYGFSAFTAEQLAELPSHETAIDSLLADLAGSLADQTLLIASMDRDLDDVLAVFSEIDGDGFDTVFADIVTAIGVGNGLLGDLANTIG